MHAKQGHKRDYTPNFVRRLANLPDVQILLEQGYGEDLNFSEKDYVLNKNIMTTDKDSIFRNSDIVLTLTCPNIEKVELMSPGQILISMLHYPTHPSRNKLFENKGIHTISLDEITNFEGRRIVQDFKATSWNAITEGFIQLKKSMGDGHWYDSSRGSITVYQLGFGEIGKCSVNAALKMGNTNYVKDLEIKRGNPVVEVIPTNSIHSKYNYYLEKICSDSLKNNGKPHLFVDASQRRNPSQTIISENILKLLPKESIIVDITADKYDNDKVVKAIQGIPTGDEEKYVFHPDDPAWEDSSAIPKKYQIKKENRRIIVCNYGWPNYGSAENKIANMTKYGQQFFPIIKTLLGMDFLKLDKYGGNDWTVEQAVYHSTLVHFNKK